MADDDDAAVVLLDGVAQGVDTLDVQVVRRLVENHLGSASQRLGVQEHCEGAEQEQMITTSGAERVSSARATLLFWPPDKSFILGVGESRLGSRQGF